MKKLVSGALVAIALSLAAAAPATAAPGAATTSVEVTAAERQEFRTELGKNPMAALIMAEYPREYAAFETQMLRDVKAGKLSDAEIGQRTYDFVASLQTAAMPYFKQAGDADIVAFGRERHKIMEMLSTVNMRACYEVGEGQGLSMYSINTLSESVLNRLSTFAALELKTALSGRKSGIQRTKATQAELTAVVEEFLTRGGSESYLTAAGAGTIESLTPKARCDNAVIWSAAILAQPPAVAARVLTLD